MRVIGLAKPKGAMKVKGGCPGFGRWRPPGPIPDCRWRAAVVVPFQSGAARRRRGVRPFPSCRRWPRGRPAHLRQSGLLSEVACTQGGAGPGLANDAVARICCWSFWLCLGSRLACRVSLGGKASRSRPGVPRPARWRSPILLCPGRPSARAVGKYHEQTCWDPKDGELCLARMKPEETLVEVRSNSDVQIDCQSWV